MVANRFVAIWQVDAHHVVRVYDLDGRVYSSLALTGYAYRNAPTVTLVLVILVALIAVAALVLVGWKQRRGFGSRGGPAGRSPEPPAGLPPNPPERPPPGGREPGT